MDQLLMTQNHAHYKQSRAFNLGIGNDTDVDIDTDTNKES